MYCIYIYRERERYTHTLTYAGAPSADVRGASGRRGGGPQGESLESGELCGKSRRSLTRRSTHKTNEAVVDK